MTGEHSFVARFALKFFEVLAAGFATAVSGFLVAHFTGFFAVPAPAPAPAAMQPAALQAPAASLPAPVQSVVGTQWPAPTAPAATTEPAPEVVNAAPAATRAMPPESKPTESTAAAPKPRETKPRNTADRKPNPAPSLESRVRAALAKANRPAPAEAPRREALGAGDMPPQPAPQAAAVPLAPLAVMPPSAAPPMTPPMSTAATPPVLPPPATVEIRSQPVAGADAPPGAQANAQDNKDADDGPLSSITKFLRSDKPLPEDQAPRPPAPVGQ